MKDKKERKHRRTWRNPGCMEMMAGADFDAVPTLSEAMGLEDPAPEYTSGPWIVERNGRAGHTYRIWRNDHAGGLSPGGRNEGYACVATSVWGEANARLVAAAPELLAACEGALAALSDGQGDMRAARASLQNAVAKARKAALKGGGA